MQYQEFINRVQNRAKMPSLEDAVKAVRVNLETLGERLTPDEATNLSAQLPEEIGRFLTEKRGEPEKFNLSDFFERVSEKEGVELPQGTYHARAVMSVLQDAVTAGEIRNVEAQLPEEFLPLFESGHEGKLQR